MHYAANYCKWLSELHTVMSYQCCTFHVFIHSNHFLTCYHLTAENWAILLFYVPNCRCVSAGLNWSKNVLCYSINGTFGHIMWHHGVGCLVRVGWSGSTFPIYNHMGRDAFCARERGSSNHQSRQEMIGKWPLARKILETQNSKPFTQRECERFSFKSLSVLCAMKKLAVGQNSRYSFKIPLESVDLLIISWKPTFPISALPLPMAESKIIQDHLSAVENVFWNIQVMCPRKCFEISGAQCFKAKLLFFHMVNPSHW